MQETAGPLGSDAPAYRRLMESQGRRRPKDSIVFLGSPPGYPSPHRPGVLRRCVRSARPAAWPRARSRERGPRPLRRERAHSFLPLEQSPSALFGLLLGTLGHAFGWPFPKGGSQRIADALTSYLLDVGGEVYTGIRVDSVEEVPRTRAVLFDVTPAPAARHRGGALHRALPARPQGLPLRTGRLQGGLRARRPIPWRGGGVPAGRDRPPRRNSG